MKNLLRRNSKSDTAKWLRRNLSIIRARAGKLVAGVLIGVQGRNRRIGLPHKLRPPRSSDGVGQSKLSHPLIAPPLWQRELYGPPSDPSSDCHGGKPK
jgi:hypothetical protein